MANYFLRMAEKVVDFPEMGILKTGCLAFILLIISMLNRQLSIIFALCSYSMERSGQLL
jgi:hypothetical protein